MMASVTIEMACDRHVIELATRFLDPLESRLNVRHSNRDNPDFGASTDLKSG
jgi:hypothetical protein